MNDLVTQVIENYSQRNPDIKKSWYSAVAENYLAARPYYPAAIIDHLVQTTGLNPTSSVLEIGAGPGIATRSLAELGCKIIALEPNAEFVRLAHRTLSHCANITSVSTTFEEFQSSQEQFDVILAASSFHWVDPDIGYAKAANLLKKNGFLVLLWNKEMQPSPEVSDRLKSLYDTYTPGLWRYETVEQQIAILQTLGALISHSGHFPEPMAGFVQSSAIYDSTRYLKLLSSYSPYIQLDPDQRHRLFTAIDALIQAELGGKISLSYVTGYHIAQICPSER